MLAYAANAPRHAERRSSPNALLVIIAAHVAAVAALMSAKMELASPSFDPPTVIDFIREDDPPPPRDVRPDAPSRQPTSRFDQPKPLVPVPADDSPTVDSTPTPLPDLGALIGPRVDPPRADPIPAPVKVAARLVTPPSELKPPYPRSKLVTGEEAVLRLRLTIDERGRVVDVEPAGPADQAFLDAARRHLLAHWRYKPATEDGRAISSSAVITLRFQLEG